MHNFIKRLLSIIFIAPIFLYLIYLNNFLFIFFLIIIFALSIAELVFLIKLNKILFLLNIFLLIFFLLSFYFLRGSTIKDFYYLVWLILIVWLTDMGGYIVGKTFGGIKLTKLSPNKTFSGLIGSLLFSQLSLFLINFFYFLSPYSFYIIFIQFLFCVVAIFGDLFYSFIKRKFNLKDYSNLLPGHGGILDRIDGLIFATILFFILRNFYEF